MRTTSNQQPHLGMVERVFDSAKLISRPRHFALTPLIAAIFCCSVLMSGQNIISTIIGGKASGAGPVPALSNYADIPGPTSVVTDSQGNVYVASPNANRIFKIASGRLSVFAGRGWPIERPTTVNLGIPAATGYLNGPYGIAIDPSGNIFIADTNAYVVWKVDTNGIMTWVAGVGDAGGGGDCDTALKAHLTSPYAVATDAAGNLYIADSADNRIRMVNMQSTPIKSYCSKSGLQPGFIEAFAGGQIGCADSKSPCGDGGPALQATMSSPQGIFVDPLGNVLISDTGDHRVRIVKTDGNIYPFAGTGTPCTAGGCIGDGGPATSAGIGTPWQVYMDAAQNVYIADSLQHRIREVTAGNISTFAGNGGSCSGLNTPPATATFCGDTQAATSAFLNHPTGVYGDAVGNIYVGDSGDQRIRQVAVGTGNINTYAGGGLSDGPANLAMLANNQDIAVDGSGNLYIADTGNNRIRKVSGGVISTVAGTGLDNYYGNDNTAATNANLSQPVGVALDSSGNVYIADTFNFVIRVLNTQSSVITVAGVAINPGELATVAGKAGSSCTTGTCNLNGPARSATLGLPKGIALDSAGNIYFADESEQVVLEVTTSGNILPVAGTLFTRCTDPTNFALCGDGGPATSATFLEPFSVAIDSTGKIFVSDAGDNRVREFTVGGNINAYAFNGITNFGPDGGPGLSNSYIFPEYVALDARDNMFVSGSSLYYTIQRVDASTDPSDLNSVASVAGFQIVSPKYFGYCCDGQPALGAFINNAGIAIDSAERLYISDAGNNRIRLVSSSSTQGLVPVGQISPQSLTFPDTKIGQTSLPMSISVTNAGSDDLVMSAPAIQGPFNFVSQSPCYGNMVPPATTCNYQVTFTPTALGLQQGQATLNSNAFQHPTKNIPLSGTGTN